MKRELLFLSHRIPYPPDKGDKIRSYHLLRALAEEFTVHLGTFVDDAADWRHADAVRALCGGESCLRSLNPRLARLRSLRGLLTGEPLSVAYYRDGALAQWVRDLATRRPLAGVFAFSSSMGPCAASVKLPPGAPRVLDLCDVDSDKWRQYAATHGGPMKWVYAREAQTLAALEARLASLFDRCLVISEAEAGILRSIAGLEAPIEVLPNGVDTDYFDPAGRFDSPFPPGTAPIVFTGAMDYHANVDGVIWFAREVLPLVCQRNPDARFFIVGSNPAPEVVALGQSRAVAVVGRVPDMRPYLAHAAVVVAPLRLARGVQNKVLEALAMARPVVATPNAVQGIPGAAGAGVQVSEEPEAIARSVAAAVRVTTPVVRGRDFVLERYGWRAPLRRVCAMMTSQGRASSEDGACAPSAA